MSRKHNHINYNKKILSLFKKTVTIHQIIIRRYNMIITNVDECDLEIIFDLQGAVFQDEPLLTNLAYFKEVITLDDLKKSYEKYDFLKAVEDDGSISGIICGYETNNTVSILAVIVRKERRNKGIGRKLVFAMEHLYPNIRCEIQSPNSMPKNIAFYESMGYVKCRQEKLSNNEIISTFEKLREIID